MRQGLSESTPRRGSFRSQWDLVSRTAPREARYFQASVAPWLGQQSISDFAQYLQGAPRSELKGLPQPIKPLVLAEFALNFHERAGTLTKAVRSSIDDYTSGRPSMRIAHQPNFLPSLNVTGQAAVCESIAKLQPSNPVQVFLIVDYDLNNDRRYRHAMIPSLSSHTGYASLCAPPLRKDEAVLIFGEKKPSEKDLPQLIQPLHDHTAHDLAIIRQVCGVTESNRYRLAERQAIIREHLLFSLRNGTTLADVNSIFLSRVANLLLGLPTIFVPGSLALRALTEHLEYLWSISGLYNHACRKVAAELEGIGVIISSSLVLAENVAPFWVVCAHDSSRIAMGWADWQRTKATGTCSRCHTYVEVTSRNIGDFLHGQERAKLIPRVVWDDLLDGFAWGHMGGCSYRGGLEHYMFTTAVAQRLGLTPLPEFLSEYKPRGPLNEYEHAAQQLEKQRTSSREQQAARKAWKLARSGRASVAYSLLWKPDFKDLGHSFQGTR